MDGFLEIFNRAMEETVRQMIKEVVAQDMRWENGGIAAMIKERAKVVLDTDPEVKAALRQAVLSSIAEGKHPKR